MVHVVIAFGATARIRLQRVGDLFAQVSLNHRVVLARKQEQDWDFGCFDKIKSDERAMRNDSCLDAGVPTLSPCAHHIA